MKSISGSILTIFFCLMIGCAAAPEVKQASFRVGEAFESFEAAQRDFKNIFISELQIIRGMMARSIENAAVVHKIETLSAEEKAGNLTAIAQAINIERQIYRDITAELMALKIPVNEQTDYDAHLKPLFPKKESLLATADQLEAAGALREAEKLRARAQKPIPPYESIPTDIMLMMQSLLDLSQTISVVNNGIRDLDNYLGMMRSMHDRMHRWIETDIRVDGAKIAKLVSDHKALFMSGNAPPADAAVPSAEGGVQ